MQLMQIMIKGDVIKIYPQPATIYATIQFIGDEDINNKEFVIHNIVGEKVYLAGLYREID